MGKSKQIATMLTDAPAALDTLDELAAALGDDANFSTTVTNSIATKLPLAGGTVTGNITMGGMMLKPSSDGGSIGLNRNPDNGSCLLYTSPSPRDLSTSRMPSSA